MLKKMAALEGNNKGNFPRHIPCVSGIHLTNLPKSDWRHFLDNLDLHRHAARTNEKSKKLLMFDVWRHAFAFTCVRLQEPGLAGGGRNADQSF